MTLNRIFICLWILSLALCKLTLTSAEWSYPYDSTDFLPNYARSFPGLSGLAARGLLLPSSTPHTVPKNVPDEEEAHGFHFGSELESRSLTGYPDLSPLFSQPASTYDLINMAQSRLLHTIYPQPKALSVPQTTAPPPNEVKFPPTGDYSNPFFRPIYARPPAPTRKNLIKKECNCPCTAGVTTTPPVEEALISTSTTVQPPVEPDTTSQPGTTENPGWLIPVSVRLTTLTSTTTRPTSSVDELVVEAFSATRQAGEAAESKDSNTIAVEPVEDSEKDTSATTKPSFDESATTTTTTTTTTTSTQSTTTAGQADSSGTEPPMARLPKKIPENNGNPFRSMGSVVKIPNRRFNSLLDLSLRRGGKQHADLN